METHHYFNITGDELEMKRAIFPGSTGRQQSSAKIFRFLGGVDEDDEN